MKNYSDRQITVLTLKISGILVLLTILAKVIYDKRRT